MDQKQRNKTICVEDGMIESIKNFLQLTSEYRKVARYKVNIRKSNAFLHASKEQVEFEIKKMQYHLHQLPHKTEY